ncbi:MAG: PilZ domain-containing protein [Lentisphaerae bacterium]|nr:PilZ domain-containing protein [Lentisphaerota bacterium]
MERRKDPRVETCDRVCITVLPEKPGNPVTDTFYCGTDDLSESGLRFSGKAAFKKGQTLKMLIVHCASSYWGFEMKGRVVWVRKKRPGSTSTFGIEFAEIGAATRIAWHEALERTRGRS